MKQRKIGTLLLLEKLGFDRGSVHFKPANSRNAWRQRKAGRRRLRATIARMRRQATFATSQKFTSMHARFAPPHRWMEEKLKIAEHKQKGRGQHPPSFHLPPPRPQLQCWMPANARGPAGLTCGFQFMFHLVGGPTLVSRAAASPKHTCATLKLGARG